MVLVEPEFGEKIVDGHRTSLLFSVLNWQNVSIDIQDNITGNWTETDVKLHAGLNV